VAGINQIPSVAQQIRLVAHLRWMLFKNALRTVKGRLEAVSSGILWLMMTGIVLGGAVFFGFATYILVSEMHWARLAVLPWIISVFWQVYPIFASTVGAQFDFSNLLRFPLRFSSFFALSIVYGLFDPGAVASCIWLFCMWVGIGIARPAMLPWALIVLFAFAAMNLFFARMLLAWIEKWLARRRSREVLGFIFVLMIICVQFIGPAVAHFQNRHAQLHASWLLTLLPVANALPPGLAGRALQFGLAANFAHAGQSLFFLVLYAAAFFWLLRIRLAAQYRGENLSETSALAPPSAPVRKATSPSAATAAAAASWEIPGLSRPVSAIFEKEVRYAMRSGIMLLNFIIPVLLIAVLAFSPHRTHGHDDFFRRAPEMIFPLAIAYTLLIQTNWVFNCFAFEATGIQFLLLSPVRFRDIMLGKNLFLALISAMEALLVWAAVSVVFAPPSLVIVAASFAGLLYATIANCAIGNILSICYPRRLEFGVFRQKKQSGVSVFFGLITQAVLIGLGALVLVLTMQVFHRVILAVPIFLVFAAIAFVGYRLSLARIDRLAMSHRETLTAELCRQE
jgi:ABC-2 type transport system permease protein